MLPNTGQQQIHLIPFKRKIFNKETRKRDKEVVEVQIIFGYPGLRDLAFRSGLVVNIQTEVVLVGDLFDFEYGTNAFLRHKPSANRRGNAPVAAYMVAEVRGGHAFEVMSYPDVLAIRNGSQAYRQALAAAEEAKSKGWKVPLAYSEAPWVRYELAMARKTVFRAGSKWLPQSVELAAAHALDEAQDRRGAFSFGRVMDAPTVDGKVDYLGAAADEAMYGAAGDDDEPEDNRGAAFGQREPQQDQRRDQQQDQQRERASPTPTVASDAPPAFEQYLFGIDGDTIATETGTQTFTNMIAWVQAYAEVWMDCTTDQEAMALSEFNEEGLVEARADAIAARMIDGLLLPSQRMTQSPTTTATTTVSSGDGEAIAVIVVPEARGKPSWSQYAKEVVRQVDGVSGERWSDFLAAQRNTILQAPRAQLLLMCRAIVARARALDAVIPEWVNGAVGGQKTDEAPKTQAPAQEEAKPDQDLEWAQRTAIDVEHANALDDVHAMAKSAAIQSRMTRLRTERPDLFKLVDDAFAKRMATGD
jgi:phage RecT family recombinase